MAVTVGVLALQGGFHEHLSLLRNASTASSTLRSVDFSLIEVRNPGDLSHCDALVVPGGESTTMSLIAAESGLLEPLREFVA
jgi:pyridoxal 5'-phosphate synthase pdxT subunit